MSVDTRLIREKIAEVASRRHKLIIICSNGNQAIMQGFISTIEVPRINLNLYLSKELLEVPIGRRPLVVSGKVQDLVNTYQEEFICLYNIELLFHPDLKTNPLQLLENISRYKGLVVAWNGQYNDEILTYSSLGHPEYQAYDEVHAELILL
jgi:hypothetical protein